MGARGQDAYIVPVAIELTIVAGVKLCLNDDRHHLHVDYVIVIIIIMSLFVILRLLLRNQMGSHLLCPS